MIDWIITVIVAAAASWVTYLLNRRESDRQTRLLLQSLQDASRGEPRREVRTVAPARPVMRNAWRDFIAGGRAPQTDAEYRALRKELGPIYRKYGDGVYGDGSYGV